MRKETSANLQLTSREGETNLIAALRLLIADMG
jgi:hypothetical protein